MEGRQSGAFQLCTWTSFKVPVVVLASPRILQDWERTTGKDKTSGVIGPLRVGCKDDIKVLVSVTGAQDRLHLCAAMRRESHIVVARRKTGGLMIGLGVYLKPDINHGLPL